MKKVNFKLSDLPGVLFLVIENGTETEFRTLFKNQELQLYLIGLFDDCALYGRLEMLKILEDSEFSYGQREYSNALVHALIHNQYHVAEYLFEKGANSILAYDIMLKNNEYSKECYALFEKYKPSIVEHFNKCKEERKLFS